MPRDSPSSAALNTCSLLIGKLFLTVHLQRTSQWHFCKYYFISLYLIHLPFFHPREIKTKMNFQQNKQKWTRNSKHPLPPFPVRQLQSSPSLQPQWPTAVLASGLAFCFWFWPFCCLPLAQVCVQRNGKFGVLKLCPRRDWLKVGEGPWVAQIPRGNLSASSAFLIFTFASTQNKVPCICSCSWTPIKGAGK